MKRIQVTKNKDLDYKKYVKRTALDSDYSTLIKDECAIFEGDELKIIYKQLDFDTAPLVNALNTVKYYGNTRTSKLKSISRVFGFMPRMILQGKDYCRITALATESPGAHKLICEYGKQIADLYKEVNEGMFKIHKEETEDRVRQDYIIPGTPFTSGIVNRNNQLKYHFDAGNFKSVYSCMLALRADTAGGHLSLPEYDVGLEIAHNSVLFFDGQNILHGVTPIKKMSTDAFRYTIVYYSMEQMWQCLPLDEEIARIRNLKMERELKRLK